MTGRAPRRAAELLGPLRRNPGHTLTGEGSPSAHERCRLQRRLRVTLGAVHALSKLRREDT